VQRADGCGVLAASGDVRAGQQIVWPIRGS
jgi:hypothetical protein